VRLNLPYVWSDAQGLHHPDAEIWVGKPIAAAEVSERAERIRAALQAAGAREIAADEHPDEHLLTVHDAALLDYLRDAWQDWQSSGLPEDPGQDRVVPYLFPHPGLLGALPLSRPAAASALAGQFAYDTMTAVGSGTWEAARAAADVALTATDLVLGGERLAYACCRPPGHHVTRSAFGGSCYLNNAAIAAARLRAQELGRGPVAIVDIDAHHGNGAQSIFYTDPGVLTGSVHVDPGAGWFPHFLGFADESGSGPGEGANRNLPLAPGSEDEEWLEAIESLCDWAGKHESSALVVALGVDAAAGDPESPLRVSAEGYHRAGRLLGGLGLPTVVVQEGGYDLDRIGELVTTTLAGLLAGSNARQ
jgi:acetoin utilization deacetylase AcuC-like enzyme